MAEVVYEHEMPGLARSAIPRISLRAVFSGVVVALILQIMLLVLGGAIGLTVFQAEAEAETARGVGIGAAIWLILSLCASSLAGGWVAAVVSRTSLKRDGVLHGVITWATVSLLGLFLVSTTLTRSISGLFGLASSTAAVAAQQPAVQTQVQEGMQEIRGGLGEATREAQATVEEGGEQAAEGAAIGLWGLFFAHLLPLLAAVLGGLLGAGSERRHLVKPTRREVIVEPVRPGPTVPQPT
jgi:hypothetical protein